MKPVQFTSALRYRDPEAAIAWLIAAFGMRAHFVARAGEAADAPVVHAQMKLGDAMVFVGPDHENDAYGMRTPLALNGTNQCICIALEDVEGAFVRATAAGATVITAPRDTPYGAREFSVKDPEGHVWSIGNYWGEP
ncbi:hypothetical protein sos41_13440 [Alphaproteobacteria bacterium SO-S41]|nr:hypothetical protein sos41_13440 [Alphaproteobacteria bacterium SO-S41]